MLKNKFIKVHSTGDNSVIIINYSNIITVGKNTIGQNDITTVYMDDDNIEDIAVNESIEKIYQNIVDTIGNKSDFLMLHSNENNSVIIVNTKYINVISRETEDDYTSITICDNEYIEEITVNETPEKIFQYIEDNLSK